jgi:hypothetical protein
LTSTVALTSGSFSCLTVPVTTFWEKTTNEVVMKNKQRRIWNVFATNHALEFLI